MYAAIAIEVYVVFVINSLEGSYIHIYSSKYISLALIQLSSSTVCDFYCGGIAPTARSLIRILLWANAPTAPMFPTLMDSLQ